VAHIDGITIGLRGELAGLSELLGDLTSVFIMFTKHPLVEGKRILQ
jgi:hypothetical protein